MTYRSTIATVTAAAAAATGIVAVASQPAHAAPTEQVGPWTTMTRLLVDGRNLRASVAIWGDSATMTGARPLVTAVERKGYDARADVQAGAPTGVSVDRVAKYLRNRRHTGNPAPRTIVMAVGANDTVYGPGKVRVQVERLRRLVGPHVRIVWVTVYAHSTRPATRAAGVTQTRSKQVNAAILAARVNGRPAVTRVVDWYGYVVKRGAGKVTRDGVHPTPAAQTVRTAMIAAAV